MSDFAFEGFEPANTTPVPDVLFDELLSELNESELKVLLYIIRRTAGFKKQTDAISLTQFQKGIRKRATGEILDKGCGVKDRATIVKALASLEKRGCIESIKGSDPQGDKATSSYRIRFRSGVVGKTNHPTDIGSGQNQPPWFAKPTTGSGQNQPGVVGDSNPQETVIQPNSKQETVRQEGTYSADKQSTPGALAPTHALVSHPEYDFLWFDDLLTPTAVTVKLTPAFPDPMFSEYEDKRRSGVVMDLLSRLEAKGINLVVKWEHETLQDVIESGREYPSQDVPEEIPYQPDFTEPSYSQRNGQTSSEGVSGYTQVEGEETHGNHSTRNAQASGTGGENRGTPGATRSADTPSGRAGAGTVCEPAKERRGAGTVSGGAGAVQATLLAPAKPAELVHVEPELKALSLPAQVDRVFRWLDEIRRECSGDPMASYVANGANKKRVGDLLNACRGTANELNEKRAKAAWRAMWDSPEGKDGFSWQKPGVLTINAFCNNYGDYLERAKDAERKKRGQRRSSSGEPKLSALEQMRAEQQRYCAQGGQV